MQVELEAAAFEVRGAVMLLPVYSRPKSNLDWL